MQPVTYDFDVITDAPKPKCRVPEAAEQAPQPDAENERSAAQSLAPPKDRVRVAPIQDGPRTRTQAAE